MSGYLVVGVVVGAFVAVAGGVLVAAAAARSRPRPGARSAGREQGTVLTRREVVNRGIVALFAAALSGMVSATLAYLWPSLSGRSGGRFDVGTADELRRLLRERRRPHYDPNGRFYVVAYPSTRLEEARQVYRGPVLAGMEEGFAALSQDCTHLGCRVPFCDSSRWFECPCHGSRFNGVGEQQRGPAPRGLDHYAVTVSADGRVVVDTSVRYPGPPPGTDTVEVPPAGPHCS
jgi:cytochrome b6-f complex iron-sulfur subunit